MRFRVRLSPGVGVPAMTKTVDTWPQVRAHIGHARLSPRCHCWRQRQRCLAGNCALLWRVCSASSQSPAPGFHFDPQIIVLQVPGVWAHLAVTFDGKNQVLFYINSILRRRIITNSTLPFSRQAHTLSSLNTHCITSSAYFPCSSSWAACPARVTPLPLSSRMRCG